MASVIESLFFLFDSDASKLDAGLKESRAQNKKLGEEIEKTDAKANKLGGDLVGMAKAAGGALIAAFTVGALANTIGQVADFTDALNANAKALGVDIGELDAWDAAATAADGQAGAFTASLMTLNKGITTIATKGKGLMLPFFQELGLSLTDIKRLSGDPIAAMRELSDTFGKFSAAEAAAMGAKLGLDQGTINLLRSGRIAVDDMIKRQKELGQVTKEDGEIAEKYNDTIEETNRVWDSLKRRLVMTVLPAITTVMEGIRNSIKFLKDHKTGAIFFFGAIAAFVTATYLPAMIRAAAATIAATWPFLLAAAAVLAFAAALGLAADDVDAFLKGQDSAIGELAKKYPLVGEAIKEVMLIFQGFAALMKTQLKFIADLLTEGPTEAFNNLYKNASTIIDAIAARFPKLSGALEFAKSVMSVSIRHIIGLWELLKTVIDKVWGAIKMVSGAKMAVAGFFGDALGINTNPTKSDTRTADQRRADAADVLKRGGLGVSRTGALDSARAGAGALASAASNPLAHLSSSSIANQGPRSKSTEVRIDKVEVNTQASDPEAVSRAISNNLSTQLSRAVDNADDGIDI